MTIVARTHGGLGNQLFQLLYAKLISNGQNIEVIHDINYPHKFQLDRRLDFRSLPPFQNRCISALRIPKVLKKLNISPKEHILFLGTLYLDGYFQSFEQYENFNSIEIRSAIDELRDRFDIHVDTFKKEENLVHLRLGDFFHDQVSKTDHVFKRLRPTNVPTAIATNEEEIVSSIIKGSNKFKNYYILNTPTNDAGETLRIMSTFASIDTNDSTLAFWAALLGKSHLITSSKKLNKTWAVLNV